MIREREIGREGEGIQGVRHRGRENRRSEEEREREGGREG